MAFIGFCFSMDPLVINEVRLAPKDFPTGATWIGVFPGVSLLMHRESQVLLETLLTQAHLQGFLSTQAAYNTAGSGTCSKLPPCATNMCGFFSTAMLSCLIGPEDNFTA